MTASIDNPPSTTTEGELNGVQVPSPPANAKALIAVQFAESAGFSNASFTVSLDSQAPTEEHVTRQQTSLGCGIAAFVWNKTALDAMTLPANISYTDVMTIASGSYLLLWVLQDTAEATPIREAITADNGYGGTNDNVISISASGTAAVAGDLPLVFAVNIVASRSFTAVSGDIDTLAAQETINAATTVGWGYGAVKASGGSWSAGLDYDLANTVDAAMLGLLVKGDATGGTTYTQVIKDTVVVTAAQPGQEVAGLRPGDRIETMTDLWRIGYRGTVRQDGIRLTDQAIPTTFDIPVTRFRTLADGFNQCWDFIEFYRLFRYERDLADTASAYDALLRTLQLRFTFADSLALADAAVAQYLRQPALSDDVAVVDAVLVNSLFIAVQTLIDYARLRDNVIATYIESEGEPATTYNKLLVEGADVTDAWLAGVYRFTGRALSDDVRAWDRMTPLRLVARTVTESIAVDDRRNLPAAPQITVDVVGEVIHIDIAGYDIDIEIRPSGA